MKFLKYLGIFCAVLVVQLLFAGGALFVITTVGSGVCAADTDVEGQALEGQSAKEWLANFSQAQQQEKLAIVKIAYDTGMSRPKPVALREVWIVVATGIQETNIKNLPDIPNSEWDSAGWLQQRPSMGWGTPSQVMDVAYATNTFYDRLEKKRDYLTRPMKDLAIEVQNPSRTAYMRWNWDRTAAELVAMVANADADAVCNSRDGWQYPLEKGSWCFTAEFGDLGNEIVKRKFPHQGVDLACDGGDPIYAIADGEVIVAGPDGDFGWHVRIKHADGTISGYAHMVSGSIPVGITKGAHVSRGQILGYVGNTGHSYGAHLHFEILDSKWHYVDPEVFMNEKGLPLR